MAASAAAMLLDELMGRNRNSAEGSSEHFDAPWKAEHICKHYLAAFCPHELFVNTKIDTYNPCRNAHDDEYAEQYRQSDEHEKLGYEERLENLCKELLLDCDKRIQKGKNRLLRRRELQVKEHDTFVKSERIDEINEEISQLLSIAEQFGIEGKVDEAQKVMEKIENLRKEKLEAQDEAKLSQNQEYALASEKQMEVCECCGALLVLESSKPEQQMENHVGGKQHTGFTLIRQFMKHMDEKREKERGSKSSRTSDSSSERRNSERHSDRHRSSDSDRYRRSDRHSPDRHRSSRSDRDRDYGRSRDDPRRSDRDRSERDRGDRDRNDRERADRDRNRPRERDRDRDRDRYYERGRHAESEYRSSDRYRDRNGRDRYGSSGSSSTSYGRHSRSDDGASRSFRASSDSQQRRSRSPVAAANRNASSSSNRDNSPSPSPVIGSSRQLTPPPVTGSRHYSPPHTPPSAVRPAVQPVKQTFDYQHGRRRYEPQVRQDLLHQSHEDGEVDDEILAANLSYD